MPTVSYMLIVVSGIRGTSPKLERGGHILATFDDAVY